MTIDKKLQKIRKAYESNFNKIIVLSQKGLLGTPAHDDLISIERDLSHKEVARMRELGMLTGNLCPVKESQNNFCPTCVGYYLKSPTGVRELCAPDTEGAFKCQLKDI